MTSSVRILTTSSLDSNPSVLLVSSNGSKTLINCGEGCQRSFLESSSSSNGVGTLRVSSVNRICLTHIGHDAFGGLPGMILTTADVADNMNKSFQKRDSNMSQNGDTTRENGSITEQQLFNTEDNSNLRHLKKSLSLISNLDSNDGCPPDLEIIGPLGTKAFLHSLRHFMRREKFKVHVHESDYNSLTCNSNSCTPAQRKKQKLSKNKYGVKDDTGFIVKSVPVFYEPTQNDNVTNSKYHDENDTPKSSLLMKKQAISYLFSTPPIQGKFLIDKASALNIPKGPMYAELKAGRSVTFTDPTTNKDRTVMPEEVVQKGTVGLCVAVLYCPTLEVLSKLSQSEALQNVYREKELELVTIVHMTPYRVFNNLSYQTWCKKFGDNVDHIKLHSVETLEDRVQHSDNSPFVSAIRGGILRSLVNSQIFPMPQLFSNEKLSSASINNDDGDEARNVLKIVNGCPMMEYILLPRSRRGVNILTVKSLYSESEYSDLKREAINCGALSLAEKISTSHAATMSEKESKIDSSNDFGELIFTGTGSAVPCKHRNVTGIYLRMKNGNSVLLDVGEGTVGQLLQSWKSTLDSTRPAIDEYYSRLSGIKAVWISHPHADHHLGLLRLLSERQAICGLHDPLIIIAPTNMIAFLSEYQKLLPEIKESYIAINCRDIIHNNISHLLKNLINDLGIDNFTSVPVAHCPNSFAVVLDGTAFGRVSYSGDCRPSSQFASIGRGTDLLIHEATFEDGMEEEAVLKRHSTLSEAIEIARKMGAHALVLTHFSQRYPKIPPLNWKQKGDLSMNNMPIIFAFDFMRLKQNSLYLASTLTSALRLLYPEKECESEQSNPLIGNSITDAKDLMCIPGIFSVKGVL